MGIKINSDPGDTVTAAPHLVTEADLPPAPEYGEPVSFGFTDGPADLGTGDRSG